MERNLGVHEMSVRLFLFPCPVNHLCSKGCTPMLLNIDVKKATVPTRPCLSEPFVLFCKCNRDNPKISRLP